MEEKMIVWTILEAQIQDHKKEHKNERLKHGIKMQGSQEAMMLKQKFEDK